MTVDHTKTVEMLTLELDRQYAEIVALREEKQVLLETLKRDVIAEALRLDEQEGCPVGNVSQIAFIRGIDFAFDAISIRTLLKVRGVCVPREVIEKVHYVLERASHFKTNDGQTALEIEALEAIKPFTKKEL